MYKILVANQKGGCGKTSIATNLATALAYRACDNQKVFLADTDWQKSSLRWLKIRPNTLPPIFGLDWRDERDIGTLPEYMGKQDYLIIDGKAEMREEQLLQLIDECQIVFIPVIPSFFDVDSSRRFLKNLEAMKRVKKGKVKIFLIANRVRSQLLVDNMPTEKALQVFTPIATKPVAWISERSIYQLLAGHGLSIFDKTQKPYQKMQQQWQAILDKVSSDPTCANSKKAHGFWYE